MYKFYKRFEKDTLKLLKKMFGIETIIEGIKSEDFLRIKLEKKFNKDIDLIDISSIKGDTQSLKDYSKYKTLRYILTMYTNFQLLKSNINNYGGYGDER